MDYYLYPIRAPGLHKKGGEPVLFPPSPLLFFWSIYDTSEAKQLTSLPSSSKNYRFTGIALHYWLLNR